MSVLITGCGTTIFSHRDATNENINDVNWYPGHMGTRVSNILAVTASRRIVLVTVDGERTIMCAEPSPDVGEAYNSSMSNVLELALTQGKSDITGKLANAYSRTVQAELASLLTRTQGLQLYRNAIHSLCIDRLNAGWNPVQTDTTGKSGNSEAKGEAEGSNNPKDGGSTDVSYSQTEKYEGHRRYIFDKSSELIKSELKFKTIDIAMATVKSTLEALESTAAAKKQADRTVELKLKEVSKADEALVLAKRIERNSTAAKKANALKAVGDATAALEKAKNEANAATDNAKAAATALIVANENVKNAQAVITKLASE
ncbi:MAG: hypothetical protein V9E86_10095 [Nitrosomonas sp.]